MAVLEQIRTKAGWLILVIISIALLSFIIDPTSLQTVSNMFSSVNDVGAINGKAVPYQDYSRRMEYYSQVEQILYQGQQTEGAADRAKQKAWDSFIIQNIFEKEYEKIGLSISEIELLDLAKGNNLSPIVLNLFTDRNTGQPNWENINFFWANADANPERQILINYLEDEILRNRKLEKYNALVSKSEYINSLQIKSGVADRSTNVEFNYVVQNYSAERDSSIVVTDKEIRQYYDENQNRYEQTESRDVEYVVFSILPSEEDFASAKEKMDVLAADFAKTPEPFQFAKAMSSVPPLAKYYKKDELNLLNSDLAEFAFSATKEDIFPVYLDNYSYKTARISDIKNLPDSVRARHILINYEQTQESYDAAKHKVDSLFNVVKENPSLFPIIALTNSADGASAQAGGDLGWFTDGAMVQPFNDSCFLQPAEKIMQIETQFGFHILQVTERGKETKKVQIATIEREIMPGKTTQNNIYSMADAAISAGEKNYDKLIAYLQENGIELKKENQVQRSATRFGNYNEARDLIRWIYDANLRDVSDIIEIDNRQQLVIAAVTKIKEDGFSPIEDERDVIEATLRLEKEHQAAAEKMKQTMNGVTTLEELAAKLGVDVQQSVEGTNFGSMYISGLGVEPKLAAAVSSSEENKLYGPVAGDMGAYVYSVTAKKVDEGYTEELEKNRLVRLSSTKSFYNILLKAAKIKDLRPKFF
ncbi:MAG: peptidylprolyl isomerase [Prevotellaceae bacterium]|jgi:peptidyl-prolyl cis-trans isomerase D|nr:peptidylprolyl isomerase [Prevotellaceae bacterium]